MGVKTQIVLRKCNIVRCACQTQDVKLLIAYRGRYTALGVDLFPTGVPHPALSFPGCSSWYVAEVQDSLCSLHIAQGRCPQGSEWIPVQRRGMRGSRGTWRSQLNAAGCSLAPCSAAWLQAAPCAPDLQARWGSCWNPIVRAGIETQSSLSKWIWRKNLTKICFFLFYKHRIPSKISIPLFEHPQNVMLFDLMHTCTGYPDHMVFSEFRRRFDVLAPHLTKKHGRNYIVKDEKRVSQSTRERGAKCAAPPVPRHSQD